MASWRARSSAIVRYYVFSNDPAIRRHYLAMEFVAGEPLSEILKRGPLSFGDVELLRSTGRPSTE